MHDQLETPTLEQPADMRWWAGEAGVREALRVALPLMISSLSWTVMNFIDRLFLLKYSEEAVAAALPAGIMSFAAISFPLGVASYAATFVAQYFGAGAGSASARPYGKRFGSAWRPSPWPWPSFRWPRGCSPATRRRPKSLGWK
ncbi:MAG: MATE family efflux transporter [Pirellulales bacterium]